MAAGHSHRSLICKGIYVSHEGEPFTAASFWHILISVSPCSRAGYSGSYRESYSRFLPQLQSWRIRSSALWNIHCIYILPGGRLFFLAFSFWHDSNDSPLMSPLSIFGLKEAFCSFISFWLKRHREIYTMVLHHSHCSDLTTLLGMSRL